MKPHLPNYWVAGICKDDEWLGKFYATPEEMLAWCEKEDAGELEVLLVLDLCECQKIYEDWWENLKRTL